MKTSTVFAICVLASAVLPIVGHAQGAGAQAPTETREKFDPKRDAAKDIEKAVIIAKKQNRRILLDVGGEWCGWCHKLDKFFKTDLEVAKVLKEKFVVVKINFSPENKNEGVLSKYPAAEGYPHLYVLDKNGKFLHSQGTGELETGDHHDHDKFMKFLKTWGQ